MLTHEQLADRTHSDLSTLNDGQRAILERLVQLETRNEEQHKTMAENFSRLEKDVAGLQERFQIHQDMFSEIKGHWKTMTWFSNLFWALISGVGVYLIMMFTGGS